MGKKADLRQKALKERNIDSMLEDAKNDNKDTDAEHLQRRCDLTQVPFNKSNSLIAIGAAFMPTLINHLRIYPCYAQRCRLLHTQIFGPALLKFTYSVLEVWNIIRTAKPFTTDQHYNCDEEDVELNHM